MRHFLPVVMLFACPQLLAQFSPVVNLNSGAGSVSIQAAIDSAAHGDTLTLAPVSFVESLKVDRPITLLGDPSGGTLLDIRGMGGYGLQLDADNIGIEDLIILSNPQHTEYAIHSEPGMSGLILRNIRVIDNGRTGIDLNGLEGDEINLIEGCEVVDCGVGFGLALSSCQNVRVTDFLSSENLFGDIGILESAYTENRTEDIQFTGSLELLGRDGDGNGAVIIQSDSTFLTSGIGTEFDIDMRSGFIHRLSSQSVMYDGSPLGFILCSPDNVAQVTDQLSDGLGISDLVGRNISTGALEVWPGMTLAQALVNAQQDDLIQVANPGEYDTEVVTIDKPVTILGPNAGIAGESMDRGVEALFSGGLSIATSGVTVDGIRIQTDASTNDGLTLQPGHDAVVVRNTVIRGNVDAMGDAGQVGVRCMGDLVLEDCSFRNWPLAVDFSAGSLLLERGVVADNQAGVRMDSDNETSDRLEVKDAAFNNAGYDAFSIAAGNAHDSLVVTGVSGELHRFAFRFDAEVSYRIEDNQFFNSEIQIFGLDNTQRIGLCEANDFSLPSIVITGCTDADAENYEACATVDDESCLQGGCIDAGACNFEPLADVDDGSCDFESCADCLNPAACNYNPAATLEGECDFDSCRGCTDPAALNYDPTATIDDGSCRIAGCLDPEADNYNPDATFDNGVCFYIGCTDAAACNYDPNANLDVGGCEYTSCAGCTDARACNYDATATSDDGSCEFLSCRGCTDANAFNYDPDATIDDGSCRYLGCTDPSAVNYNPFALTDDGSCQFGGCTDLGACNFDASAESDDGSCEYTSCAGCAIEGFCNYDPTVTIHDGSMCDYLTCCGDPAATNYDPAILPQLTFGCTYGQSAGQPFFDTCTLPFACNYLADAPCEFDSCAGCTEASACNYDASATLSTSTCTSPLDLYGVDYLDCAGQCLNDINGNSVCDEEEATGCTDASACNYDPDAGLDDGSCESTSCAGCTDDVACNYDAGATINDGTCDYALCAGCTDPSACNYDDAALINAGCIYPADLFGADYVDCQGNCIQDTDGDGTCDEAEMPGCTNLAACNYSSEATQNDGSCDFSSCFGCTDSGACNYDPTVTELDNSCDYTSCAGCMDSEACNYMPDATLPLGCIFPADAEYDCEGQCVSDADGDGICDGLEIPGCADLAACNYDEAATEDDGSCDYSTCAGCTNPGACNPDPNATINDGSCDYASCIGCTDPEACNYSPTATMEDGSCVYPLDLYNDPTLGCDNTCLSDQDGDGICDQDEPRGCMDPLACNYDEDAEFNDGSCEYVTCQGCTDPEACNTNAGATIDDGSCSYPEEFNGSALYDCYGVCLEDADGDGVCDALEADGCTDSAACNYDPSATEDDGGCTYPELHYDCFGNCLEDTDGDGVCDPLEVFGCTDVTACNYDTGNTEEDGSCTYPAFDYVDCDGNCLEDADGDGVCDINEFCLGDFNEDGLRTASDILEILAAYGCMQDCGDRDLNNDGIVTAADILDMLSVFGTVCP